MARSEMSAHHVDSPEQVVTPGEELWVKIIDLDLARRRISLSIKQAAEGGELAADADAEAQDGLAAEEVPAE
jgi:small subunit ribosomal protein S1